MIKRIFFIISLLLIIAVVNAQDAYHSGLQTTLANDYSLPAANYVFFDNEADIMSGVTSYGNSSSVQSQSGEDFSLKAHIVVSRAGTQSFDSGWFIRNKAAVQQGNTLLATFYVRSIGAPGKISFFIENATTYNKEVFLTMPIDTAWRRFFIPFSSMASYGIDGLSMGFHLGFQAQTIQVGGFTLLNYASSAQVADLPDEVNNEFYGGYEADAPWRAEAAQRIDSLRKVNLQIMTRDNNGMEIENAGVKVKMLRHEFAFGTAIKAELIAGNNRQNVIYENKLINLDGQGHGFNWVVFENDLKWPAWESEWFVNKNELINAVSWLADREIKIRGHTLLWPGIGNMPSDIGANITNQSLVKNRISGHIETILNYPGIPGNVQEWDVLNEINTNTDIETSFRNTPGYTTGREYFAEVFQKARQEDSTIGLWINDYITLSQQQEAGAVQYDNLKLYIQELLDAQVDLEGVGFQGHIGGFPNSISSVLNTLDDFHNSFGLKAKITEFDTPSFVKESLGATYLKDFMTASFSHPSINGFLFWNFWDGATWLNAGSNLFRQDWSMTPAGDAYVDLVFDEWWTDETIFSDATGLAETRAFKGLYEISYICEGITVRDTVNLLTDASLEIVCDNITTGLDQAFRLNLEVFPNPSQGLVQIHSKEVLEATIHVHDLNGRSVYQATTSIQNFALDLSDLAAGIYVLKIDTDKGWFREKLVIK